MGEQAPQPHQTDASNLVLPHRSASQNQTEPLLVLHATTRAETGESAYLSAHVPAGSGRRDALLTATNTLFTGGGY